MTTQAKIRCAIYTRKSSEEGLEQSFNSLDAQREACEAYVRSQASFGWQVIPELYDDGGISGGTMERPALQRLLRDLQIRKIDIIVVYKIDRLTRSLMDFSRIVEIFDRHDVSFVSITQQFNTTTSMGRLTLNVLLSFAQFEREVTAERIRDKVAASKKKGMWMGGNVPLGYRAVERKLVIDEQEARSVRWLFVRYLDLRSLTALSQEAHSIGLHRRETRKETETPFGRGKLHHLLTNPIYVGKIRHKDAVYDGEHEPIVDDDLFHQVQAALAIQAPNRRSATNTRDRHLLGGLLCDDRGRSLLLSHTQNHGRRYRYYASRPDDAEAKGIRWRLSSSMIEPIVEQQLRDLLNDKLQLSRWSEDLHQAKPIEDVAAAAVALNERYQRLDDHVTKQEILRGVFHRIILKPDTITFEISPRTLFATLAGDRSVAAKHGDEKGILTIVVPVQLKRRGVESRIVIQGATTLPARKDPMLIGMIARAHLYLEALTDGTNASNADIAARFNAHGPDISRILPMAFLSPKITEAILTGQQPNDLSIAKLTRMLDLPIGWKDQHALLMT